MNTLESFIEKKVSTPMKKEGSVYRFNPCIFDGCSANDACSYSPNKNLIHCFSCGNSAKSPAKVLSLMEGITYQEAKAKLNGSKVVNIPHKPTNLALANHQSLLKNKKPLDYLVNQRRLSSKIIKQFKIGFYQSKNFDDRPMMTFPYFKGEMVEQTKHRDIDDKKFTFFNKGEKKGFHYLYNLNALKGSKQVMIVEGEIDVCSAYEYQTGVPTIGLGSGCRTVNEKWRDLFRNVEEVLIGLDNDGPGRDAVVKLAELFGDKAKIIQWPRKDLNQCLQEEISPDEIMVAIKSALTLEQIRVYDAINAIPETAKVGSVIGDILKMVAKRPETEEEDYLGHIKERFESTVTYQQRMDFKRQIKMLRKELAREESKDDKPVYEMSEEEKAMAMHFLKNPNVLDLVAEYSGRLGLVSERENFIASFLTSMTRKMEPDSIGHALISGAAGSGKSTIANLVFELCPPEDRLQISSTSAQAFNYMDQDSLDRKLIYIAELDGANENDQTALALRLMMSERKLSRYTAGRNAESGRMEAQRHDKSVRSSFLITTNLLPESLEHQTSSRMLILSSSDSTIQSEKVKRTILLQQTRQWKRNTQQRDEIKLLLQNAQRLLDVDLQVDIPFAPLLSFPSHNVSSRRALKLWLNSLKAVCFLRQHSKDVHTDESGQRYIEADIVDYELCYKYMGKVLAQSMSEVSDRARRVLEVGCLLETAKKKKRNGRKDWTFNELRDFAKQMKISIANRKDARDALTLLAEEELVKVTEGQIGIRGKSIYFKIDFPYTVDPKTKEVHGLDELNSEVTTPEELREALNANNM